MGWLEPVSLGLSVAQWVGGAANKAGQYETQSKSLGVNMDYLTQSITKLNEQKNVLGQAFELERGNITDEYGLKFGSMLDTFDANKSKSGFSYSGTLNRKEDQSTQALENSFGSQLEQWAVNKETTFSNIENQISDMNMQFKQASIQKNYADDHDSFWDNLF